MLKLPRRSIRVNGSERLDLTHQSFLGHFIRRIGWFIVGSLKFRGLNRYQQDPLDIVEHRGSIYSRSPEGARGEV